ncbi:MAG: type sorting protein [Verrucomicrobiaceae bacterium]|nr:type sorting protein [Verrucomicrobiaceae bacterium]
MKLVHPVVSIVRAFTSSQPSGWLAYAITAGMLVLAGSAFGQAFDVPNLVVEQPVGTAVAKGSSKAFGAVASGSTADLVFTIRNAGTVDLTGLGITIDGPDAEMFSVVSPPTAPVIPGGSTTFTLRFAPTNGGGHTAALHIATNDFVNNPFDINLSDTAAASANTRLTSLTLNYGTLVPPFATGTTSYAVSVPYTVTSVAVTPTKAQNGASIKVNGTTVVSGSASTAISLAAGTTVVNTVVTAADGTSSRTYAITFTRSAAAVGDVDVAFDPRATSSMYAVATQPDGKLLVGGSSYYLQPNGGTRMASGTSRG